MSASLGALMLSMLLGAGTISRQIWGWITNRVGGLLNALVSSALPAIAMVGFLHTQDEVGLFTVSVAFGLGFSALIPANVLIVRELFPLADAHCGCRRSCS